MEVEVEDGGEHIDQLRTRDDSDSVTLFDSICHSVASPNQEASWILDSLGRKPMKAKLKKVGGRDQMILRSKHS